MAFRACQLSVSFVIEGWAACAPGLDTPEGWAHWSAAPWLPQGEPRAALAAVPPLLRRRFSPLGRLAAQAAFDVDPAPASAAPEHAGATVFASRYGETGRCLDLLADQARGDALSPTSFGLSVHNAIGAMVAISREDRRPSTAIAAGGLTAAAGVVEAAGMLADGMPAVSLVVYDAPLPACYAQFEDEPSAHFAWAWRLRLPRPGERALRLDWSAAAGAEPDAGAAAHLPGSLQALWFGLSGARALSQRTGGQRCTWSRDD